jgi:hypothetical protein
MLPNFNLSAKRMWTFADNFPVASQNEKTTLLGKTKQEYVQPPEYPQIDPH